MRRPPQTRAAARTSGRRRRDSNSMPVLGGVLLLLGITGAIVIASSRNLGASPAIGLVPWLPIAVGLVLLVWSLARATHRPRSEPGDALDALPGHGPR